MVPLFVDVATSSDEDVPPPIREVNAIGVGYPGDNGELSVEVLLDDIPAKFREIVFKVGGRAMSDQNGGGSMKDLRLIGWDIDTVWQTLNGMLLRSKGPRIYDFHASIYKKWSNNKFGDLRRIATQGWYCDGFKTPFEKYVKWVLPESDAAMATQPHPEGRTIKATNVSELIDIMTTRVVAMVDLWDKYTRGGKYE